MDLGMRGIFDAESHFWWHKNVSGERRGRACGTSRGRVVNVFSRISAVILARPSTLNTLGICGKTDLGRVSAGKVNSHRATD